MTALDAIATTLLHRLDPERAHEVAIHGLALGLGATAAPDVPALSTRVLGMRFPNPIGLAAGFDKDARAARPLARLGFGFVECGTVTPKPQPGNPSPRLFRLPEDGAIINRMGFNGGGLDLFCKRLARLNRPRPNGGRHGIGRAPLGANVGINKEGADPLRDYPELVARVSPYVDYVTINLSSPNTPGLRDLQSANLLGDILDAIAIRNPERPPLFVKLAPDINIDSLESIVEAAVAHGADGLILTNTTISRPPGLQSPLAREKGGLSGHPLRPLAVDMLRRVSAINRGRLTLVSCGGIASGRDIFERIREGADLVQIYTSFVLEGPGILSRLKRELLDTLRDEGLEMVDDIRSLRSR
ncbi:quinone-dependent dihydroorotate dehydrogenase [Brytella acorum]|uniref:Dihydroorotate dehydrogenase (quinone) n=1 Tax=Brytella acorum TaxID=2959299 RepID=A0AA35UUV1_9PROT|nr:quinone-dependent dihydroorotate dehydrogenase [Brytella acorum]MDF3623733.1 quinone-dependent dihydroorotate dehydrogenase [Brytella acorum]CAI9119849.1 quinone-dependent dihydroorotate dehydrogenase [Brytella acorum]